MADAAAGRPAARPARRVLADTRRVVGFDGDVAHRWHPARKHPEPVLRGDRPWDGTGAFVYGSVLRRGDRLGLWYQARAAVGGANTHAVAYAESGDGLRWEKPDLGVVPFEGSAANNLTDAVLHFPSVGREGDGYWAVGHAAAGASAYGVDPGYPARGVYRLRSEDGARWRRDRRAGDGPLWPAAPGEGAGAGAGAFAPGGAYGPPGDVNAVVYDAPRRRYLGAEKRHIALGGFHRRAFACRTSADGLTWTGPRMALAPDEADDRRARDLGLHRADFYGLTFHPYPEFVLGFVWVFYMTAPPAPAWPARRALYGWGPDGRIAEVQTVLSYDGEFWVRPPGRPALIAAGERGAWDGANLATAAAPVDAGDETFHYYGGGPIFHGAHARPPDGLRPPVGAYAATGLARMGRDRYASFGASAGGSVLLDHGPVAGRRLRVNAAAAQGSVRAAVLDAAGRPLPGLDLESCRPFHGDAVDGEVGWAAADLSAVPAGQPVAIRFVLQEADLYAYEVTDR